MKKISFLAVIILLFLSFQLNAQKLSATQVDNIVNSKNYVFVAQYVNPSRGGSRYLTQRYSLKVAGDSLIVNLPFYGVAYTAPINTSDVGFDFTTTNFDYNASKGKHNKYEILIRTKDKMYNASFTLSVQSNGTAFLIVNSADKESISYKGYIEGAK